MDYEEMTREERAALLLTDPQLYVDIIPMDQGYWYQILDGTAKTTPHRNITPPPMLEQ